MLLGELLTQNFDLEDIRRGCWEMFWNRRFKLSNLFTKF
jgi:hypothetical protein